LVTFLNGAIPKIFSELRVARTGRKEINAGCPPAGLTCASGS
jgi:hypothetical protein